MNQNDASHAVHGETLCCGFLSFTLFILRIWSDLYIGDRPHFKKFHAGLSIFHFDVHVFLLKFVRVKKIWVHIRAREVFETAKLLLASL